MRSCYPILFSAGLTLLPVPFALAAERAEAERFLSAEKVGPSANVKKVALTSCNVLYGLETSANAETQRGFGDSSQRIESRVSLVYQLMGLDDNALQALTEQICADAAESLAKAGYSVVPASQVSAQAEFAKLHAGGQQTPYRYERAGTQYLTFAPAGQQVIDNVYKGKVDSLFGNFKAMSTDGPAFTEARLAKALGASAVHVNIMVDFASASGNTPKGLWGRLSGSDTARIDSQLAMSVNGFMTMIPEDRIDCSSGFCQGANDARLVAKVVSKAPLIGSASPVREIIDAKTTADKVDGAAAAVISGLAALAGQSVTAMSLVKKGVIVDPQAYAQESRKLAQSFTGMAVSLLKP